MVAKCISCPQKFSSGAALNFHMKKIHGKQESSSTKTEPSRQKSAVRMLEFGDMEGVRDESIDPFRLGTVKLKVDPKTNSKEILVSLPSPNAAQRSSSKEQTRNNKNLKRKSTSSDSEDSECDVSESPVKDVRRSPTMPKLIPQVDLVPNRSPKKSKQAKHMKYTKNEDGSPESITRPSTSTVKKLTVSEKFPSASSQASSHREFLHTDSSTDESQILTTTPDKKRQRKARQISGSTSSQYSGNSVSGDDNRSTVSSVAKSSAGRSNSSKTITCPVCDQTGFKTPRQFTNHLEVHEGKRPYLCPVEGCGMGYETDLKLLEHVSIRHSKEAMFICTACDQGYKTERGLEKHKCK